MPETTTIKKRTVLAMVTLFSEEGDPERVIPFMAKEVGPKANLVEHADHEALLQRTIDYFKLKGEVDRYLRRDKNAPENTDDDVVVYTPELTVYNNPEDVWSVRLITVKSGAPVQAYEEDDGELQQEITEQRRDKVATRKASTATRRRGGQAAKPKAEPKVAQAATIDDLPLKNKPASFEVPGQGALPVKMFGKLHREMKNPDGSGRIPDPSRKRTAQDDVVTYRATSYQLGKVTKVLQNSQVVIIVAKNGVGILQVIRAKDTEAMKDLMTSIEDKGKFKGNVVTI